MLKTMRIAWLGCALIAAPIAISQTTQVPSHSPYATGSVQDGTAKAGACLGCHGLNGNSTNPQWPVLAGQNATYIAQQLRLFRSGARVNPVMQPFVANLQDKDIDDLAVYYAAQTPAGLEADPSYWKAGEQLYRRGDQARGVPACTACHGPLGNGNPAAGYPALRAQHSVYTVKQLNDYASDARYQGVKDAAQAGPNSPIMSAIAKRLTPQDVRDLASYIQGMR